MKILLTILLAIAGVSASAQTMTAPKVTVPMTWTDNATNESGFVIQRHDGMPLSSWVEIGRTGTNVTTYTDESASESWVYRYRVAAFNSAGVSGWTNELTVPTPAFPPAVATVLKQSGPLTSGVPIQWEDNAANETGWILQRTLATPIAWAEISRSGANVTATVDSTAAAGTTYRYRVASVNSAGVAPWSNEVEVTTPPLAPPGAPTSLRPNGAITPANPKTAK